MADAGGPVAGGLARLCEPLRELLLYLETTAKLLKLLLGISNRFSKCALETEILRLGRESN